jgi:hypothetical protein
MELSALTRIISLTVTLGFGVYFSYKDITKRIIPNIPLLAFFLIGVALNLLIRPHEINDIAVSFGIVIAMGVATYILNIWPPGDSKLFIAATIYFIPFAKHTVSLAILNLALPFALCYAMMFFWFLAGVFIKKEFRKERLRHIAGRTARSFLSAERLVQSIMAYAASLLIPLNMDITLKTIMMYTLFMLVQNYLAGYFKKNIKIWHIYGIVSVGLLVFIKINAIAFPLVNFLYLLGFVCFFSLYLSLDFFANMTFIVSDSLRAGMKISFNICKSGEKIFSALYPPKNAEILVKEGAFLAETDIASLKESLKDTGRFYIPIRTPIRPLPFAPFIIASTLFILITLFIKK